MVSQDLVTSAFNGLASHIAVLDAAGFIVYVNASWRRFAVQNGSCDPGAYVGANYIDLCRRSAEAGDKLAIEAIEGISAVVSGAAPRFSQRYPCNGPGVDRWFLMTVTPVHAGSGAVIAHDDVTPLVRAEIASAASERRLRLCLEAGQMGTFEIDLEKEEIVLDLQQAKLLRLPASTNLLRLGELDSMLLDSDSRSLKERIIDAGPRYSEELRVRMPDSSERWLSFAAAPQPHARQNSGPYFGISLDVTERKLEERNRVLAQEVQHRVKNMLTVVLAIARQTVFHSTPSSSAEKFAQRVAGLGASFALLTKAGWKGVSLSELIETQLAAFTDSFRDQVSIEGPAFTIQPPAAQVLGMAFHELATNSIKYGALSKSGGCISIQWNIRDGGQDKQFHMSWSEHGGPESKAPASRGFGYTVIVSAVESSLDGKVQLQYPGSGLVWEVTAPLEEIIAPPC
ncbi:MAG: sensor histidine kinase [Rhodomicrobium sp.]